MKLECGYMRIQKTKTACGLRCDALHKSHCGKVVCFFILPRSNIYCTLRQNKNEYSGRIQNVITTDSLFG